MTSKTLYMVIYHAPKPDVTRAKIFAHEESARAEYEKIKKSIKENYTADEPDTEGERIFMRYDRSETNVASVQMIAVNGTDDGKMFDLIKYQ